MQPLQDPDSVLIVLFKSGTSVNPARSLKEGRPIFEDIELCEIRQPGSRDVKVFPAHAKCPQKKHDPYSGSERSITYAERFAHQYQQFTAQVVQTRSGTPLEFVPFLTEARRAEMRGLNIYTVEALAHIDGQELKNLGQGGRELKNQAEAYIERVRQGAPAFEVTAELEALRARNRMLEDDNTALKSAPKEASEAPKNSFDDMSVEQLREYIIACTGHAPHGALSQKVLKRMAEDATSKAA
jgi:predicted RecB family nuclease